VGDPLVAAVRLHGAQTGNSRRAAIALAQADFILAQSNAIMLYAASRSRKRLIPDSGPAAGLFFERLFYFVTEVIARNRSAFSLTREGDEHSAGFLAGRSLEALVQAERFLSDAPYMAGDGFTLVDIGAYTSAFAVRYDIDWPGLPLLNAWFTRINARPGVVRGRAAS
jgi:GST-like protein